MRKIPFSPARSKPVQVLISGVVLFALSSSPVVSSQRAKAPGNGTSAGMAYGRSVRVHTEPGAAVWIDGVRRGTTDTAGQLLIEKIGPGRHILRVRARGFSERSEPIVTSGRQWEVRLTHTKDQSELLFQDAEDAREKAMDDSARKRAEELYRRAIQLRPVFPTAHLGQARVLLDENDTDGALKEIAASRRGRPVYPEASAVEGRILRASGDELGAIRAYRRAIREGGGFQPEAFTGLGIVYEDDGKYDDAIAAFRKAIVQLSDSEPVLYQLLGACYERQEKNREALAAYDKYLQLAPDGKLAPAVRSIVEQLREPAAQPKVPPNEVPPPQAAC